MAKDAPTKAIGKLLHGQGKSSRFIAKECKVTPATAAAWATEWTEKGFPKGFAEAKLVQAGEKALVKERERQGLNKARVEAKVLKLMDAKKGVFFMGAKVCDVPDNSTQLGATTLAADILNMKRTPEQELLEAGVFAFYKSELAKKRGRK